MNPDASLTQTSLFTPRWAGSPTPTEYSQARRRSSRRRISDLRPGCCRSSYVNVTREIGQTAYRRASGRVAERLIDATHAPLWIVNCGPTRAGFRDAVTRFRYWDGAICGRRRARWRDDPLHRRPQRRTRLTDLSAPSIPIQDALTSIRKPRRCPSSSTPNQSHHPGLHRQERHVPFGAGDQIRHRRSSAAPRPARAAPASGPAGVRHRHGSARRHRRRRLGDLCAAAGRGRRDLRSDRRRDPTDRLHHRRHSGARHGAGQARAARLEVVARRTQLPRRDDGGRVQDRHHAGQYLRQGQRRHRVSLGNADLRGRVPDNPAKGSARPPPSASAAIPSRAWTSSKCLKASSPTTAPSRS